MATTGSVDCDVEIGIIPESPIGSFPTVKVTAAGLTPKAPVGLYIVSTPIDGADKGTSPTVTYPLDQANPASRADENGSFAYGPQNAKDLFPDALKREVRAQVITVVGEASATAHFG